MGPSSFVCALLLSLCAVGLLANEILDDAYNMERDIFLSEKGRSLQPPDLFAENNCVLHTPTAQKVRQMVEAAEPFIYSQSGLVPGGPQDGNLGIESQLRSDYGYTRLAFVVRTDLTHNTTRTFKRRFEWAADPDFTEGCAFGSNGDCADSSCRYFEPPFTVNITVSKARVTYSLSPLYLQTLYNTGSHRNEAPFMYYPVDDDAPSAACMGTTVSEVRCIDGGDLSPCNIGDPPCEPSFIPDTVDPLVVESHCGAKSDPVGIFDTELNQACVAHCCPGGGTHRRWAAGPSAHVFSIGTVPSLIIDVVITVTSLEGQRSVSLYDVTMGSHVVDSTDELRVIVNTSLGNLLDKLPVLNEGSIVVWDAGDNDGHISQTPDPTVNPYGGPGVGFGLTPTRRNMGTAFGWAYLNESATKNLGANGGYGSPQGSTVYPSGPNSSFGTSDACSDTSYAEYHGVPGWENVAGGPESLCRISHHLNDLTDQVLGAPDPLLLNLTDHQGSHYLFPGYNLARPNGYIYKGDTLVFELFPEELQQYPNLRVNPDLAIKDTVLRDLQQHTSNYIEYYIDVSEGFAPLSEFSRTTGLYASDHTCSVHILDLSGTMYFSIVNPGFEAGEYFIKNVCTSNGTDITILTQPDTITPVAGPGRTVNTLIPFEVSYNSTSATETNSVVTCTSTLTSFERSVFDPIDEISDVCVIVFTRPIGNVFDVDKEGDGANTTQIILISVGSFFFVVIIAGLGVVLYRKIREDRKSQNGVDAAAR